MKPLLLGIDPGLAHLGYALVEVKSEGFEVVRTLDGVVMDCIETSKSHKKLAVKASDDNTKRARFMFDHLHQIFKEADQIRAICVEAMSYPRNSSASHKMGVSWGLVVALSCLYGVPIVQASPQEIKDVVCGNKQASKDDVQRALSQQFQVPLDTWTKGRREHPFDALGAVLACQDSEVIRMVRNLAV